MVDDQPMWGNNRVVAPTPGAAIIVVDLGDNFTFKGHHLSMIKDQQFDGRSRADPHKHIAEFIKVCGIFRYGDTNADAIKLKLFPSSLLGEAKIWFNELSPGVITTWEEMRQAFVSRFFPPAMFDRLMGEIRGFTQQHHESLVDAWLRMKDLLRSCHGHGIFLYKTPNEAHQLLEDRVLLKLDWSKENKTKPLRKTVAFAESEEHSPLLEKMEALTTRIDSQFKEIRGDMKEMRDGCNKCGGPYPSSDCDDKPMGGPNEEEANYASGGYQGNYYGRNYSNWRDHHENQNSNPGEENPPIPRLPKKKPDESEFEKTMREFVIAQKTANDFVKNQFYNLKTKVEQGQKNHQAAIQDIETKFGRISDHQSSRPTTNLNTKTAIFLDDSEDEAEEVKKEGEPLPKKPTQTDKPPLKTYKLKIPYPQRLNKEKIEARYAKFLDMINEVRINVPLVDVLAGMPNYGKFLKDLVSNKSKIEQISAAFLTEECSMILQNKIPPKLGDPGIFLIPCKLANSVEYLALVDLGASINLMLYSLYAALSGTTLKPTKMKKITETALDKEFDEFISGNVQEDEVKDDFEELPPKDELRIRTSIQNPPTDLELKPLSKHLEYAFLEENSLLLVVISALLEHNEKERLVSVLKNHKETFAWKTSDIPRISPSFCKHKINFEDDVKPVIQRQCRLNPNIKKVMKKRLSDFQMRVSSIPSKIALG
ncbi:reverse transcriptase domain-containing protein [Tanacetum coccineum]